MYPGRTIENQMTKKEIVVSQKKIQSKVLKSRGAIWKNHKRVAIVVRYRVSRCRVVKM